MIPSGEVEENREITGYKIAAMSLPNFLDHVGEGYLVMVPGDRSDLIAGSVASRISKTYPNLAGLILTGGLEPAHEVLDLIEGIEDARMPIYAVDTDTFQTGPRRRRRDGGDAALERTQDLHGTGAVRTPRRLRAPRQADRRHPVRPGDTADVRVRPHRAGPRSRTSTSSCQRAPTIASSTPPRS